MKRIVLLRHAESTWNQENRFTRWPDVGPTEKGLAEARRLVRYCAMNVSPTICPSPCDTFVKSGAFNRSATHPFSYVTTPCMLL